jgi:hypothetical protein
MHIVQGSSVRIVHTQSLDSLNYWTPYPFEFSAHPITCFACGFFADQQPGYHEYRIMASSIHKLSVEDVELFRSLVLDCLWAAYASYFFRRRGKVHMPHLSTLASVIHH